MKPAACHRPKTTAGFSLIELTVAVGLLTVVILALYSMFHTTQQAFHKALNQADTTEGVRSTIELIAADLQKAATPGINQMVCMAIVPAAAVPGYGTTNRLSLPGKEGAPANLLPLNEIIFLYQDATNGWHTAGYLIGPPDSLASATPLIGAVSLYRFDDAFLTNQTASLSGGRVGYGDNPFYLRGNSTNKAFIIGTRFTNIVEAKTTSYSSLAANTPRVLDGVVFFRVTALDAEGRPYIYLPLPGDNSYIYPPAITNISRYTATVPPYQVYLGSTWPQGANNKALNESAAVFFGTNMPAALDIELGILDTQQVERFRILPDPPTKARENYLANNGAQIVTLKQRVNLRTAPHFYQ